MLKFFKDTSGIALAELLLAISITAIISAVSLVGVRHIGTDMNALNADETAKEIFLSASDGLESFSMSSEWKQVTNELTDKTTQNANINLGEHIAKKPSDFDYWLGQSDFDSAIETNYIFGKAGTMYVLDSTKEDDKNLVEKILPLGSIEEDIRNGKYFIEYNARTAVVYGVFYITSDAEIDYEKLIEYVDDGGRENEETSMLDAREYRKNIEIEGVKYTVGYYGGGINCEEKEDKVSIEINLGVGIKDINLDGWEKTENGYKKEFSVGEKLEIVDDIVKLFDGYEGYETDIEGGGTLADYDDKKVYTAGESDGIITIKASTLIPPKIGLSGGGEFVFNYKDVPLVVSNKENYSSECGIKINYELVLLENENDKDGEKIKNIWMSLDEGSEAVYTYLIDKDAFLGKKYYVVRAYAEDGSLTSEQAVSEIRKVDLGRVKLTFNAEDGSEPTDAKIEGQTYAYIEYGKSEIFRSESSDETYFPIATKTVHTLAGWEAEDSLLFDSTGEKIYEVSNLYDGYVFTPTSRDEIKVNAVWDIVRQRIDIYSGSGFFY